MMPDMDILAITIIDSIESAPASLRDVVIVFDMTSISEGLAELFLTNFPIKDVLKTTSKAPQQIAVSCVITRTDRPIDTRNHHNLWSDVRANSDDWEEVVVTQKVTIKAFRQRG